MEQHTVVTGLIDEPATLHGVIREAIGRGIRSRYQAEREIPHHLLTLLMQMNEDQRRVAETP